MCLQNVLRENMSSNLLLERIAEPKMTAITFYNPFRDRNCKMERGHMYPKLWTLRPYIKTNGEKQEFPDW